MGLFNLLRPNTSADIHMCAPMHVADMCQRKRRTITLSSHLSSHLSFGRHCRVASAAADRKRNCKIQGQGDDKYPSVVKRGGKCCPLNAISNVAVSERHVLLCGVKLGIVRSVLVRSATGSREP